MPPNPLKAIQLATKAKPAIDPAIKALKRLNPQELDLAISRLESLPQHLDISRYSPAALARISALQPAAQRGFSESMISTRPPFAASLMKPSEFLSRTAPLDAARDPEVIARLKASIGDKKLQELPALWVNQKPGGLDAAYEGRHRMQALLEMYGDDPVMMSLIKGDRFEPRVDFFGKPYEGAVDEMRLSPQEILQQKIQMGDRPLELSPLWTGYAKGGEVKDPYAKERGGPSELTKQYPKLSGFLQGLMGSAPDEMGSVLDPLTAEQSKGAKYGFPIGALAQMLPFGGGIAAAPKAVGMSQRGVVKLPGGNWLKGSVEESLGGLKRTVPGPNGRGRGLYTAEGWDDLQRSDLLNNWIDKQLTRYVKNDMATPGDPIRAMAERGPIHYQPNYALDPSFTLMKDRIAAGFPPNELAQSRLGRSWENLADESVATRLTGEPFGTGRNTFGEIHAIDDPSNAWMVTAPSDTKVHTVNRHMKNVDDLGKDLGFNHLIDELRNATDPASGLPPELLLKYSSLPQVSVPQAVERVAKINAWREAKAAEANLARANNAATVVHKEYPDAGMKWVELKAPKTKALEDLTEEQAYSYRHLTGMGYSPEEALQRASNVGDKSLADALKYEGDTMGHCVGGYCEDVASGKSRIFSLRDAKGTPHVTIETKPTRLQDFTATVPDPDNPARTLRDRINQVRQGNGDFEPVAKQVLSELGIEPSTSIVQIKGKANRKPNDEYLPMVQDFVKGGKWSDVGDLQNSGLRKSSNAYGPTELERYRANNIEIPEYLTNEDQLRLEQLWHTFPKPEGFAKGGAVKDPDQMTHKPQPKTVNPLQSVARGWAAGTAGLPGDLESLARLAAKYISAPGSLAERWGQEPASLPTTDFYREWLPGKQTGIGEEAEGIGSLLGGFGATKLAKPIEKAGIAAIRNASVPATLSKQAGVMKLPGGNWLKGEPEKAVRGLKVELPNIANLKAPFPEELRDHALNGWVDKQLTRYIKNDMSTPNDPIRALAERNILHVNPDQLNFRPEMHGKYLEPGQTAVAQSPAAKAWEGASDLKVLPMTSGQLLGKDEWVSDIATGAVENNPWLLKVPPETQVFGIEDSRNLPEDLGFKHLMDELRNATDPNSGLPPELLLKYSSLPQVSVPQAVERVAKINEWRAAKIAEANAAKANNAATHLHKEYPEGFKWVELKAPKDAPVVEGEYKDPMFDIPPAQQQRIQDEASMWAEAQGLDPEDDAFMEAAVNRAQELSAQYAKANKPKVSQELQDALKYEGDTMGHCVGGYCPDVMEGKSRIFSLRDSKGQPHVTIETTPEFKRIKEQENLDRLVASGWTPGEVNLLNQHSRSLDSSKVFDDLITNTSSGPMFVSKATNEAVPYESLVPRIRDHLKDVVGDTYDELASSPYVYQSPEAKIAQIKGKSNRAPNAEYLPYVQDFVKSGQWEDVGDLKNSGLIKDPRGSGYLTAQELSDAIGPPPDGTPLMGYAKGGMVQPSYNRPKLVNPRAKQNASCKCQ